MNAVPREAGVSNSYIIVEIILIHALVAILCLPFVKEAPISCVDVFLLKELIVAVICSIIGYGDPVHSKAGVHGILVIQVFLLTVGSAINHQPK